MSCSRLIILGLVCVGFATQANAAIQVGSRVKFVDRPGNPGGEFGILDYDNQSAGLQFVTFCLERNEYINFNSKYYVYDISKSADKGGVGGGSPDPVSEKTAWLYNEFYNGTLAGYNYTGTYQQRKNSANALQNAIWFFEEEQTYQGSGSAFVALANAEESSFLNDANYSGKWHNARNTVGVMNIRKNDQYGAKAQSQLFKLTGIDTFNVVPEPATMTVWATLGCSALFFGSRRKRRQPKS